jgi:chitin disaccharide deacetylase
MKKYFIFLFIMCFTLVLKAQNETYAEKLGFPKGAKVVIMHVDDVGMSYDSNIGAIRAVEEGVATSMSVMMPCSWVPGFVHYLKNHPQIDAGLHLTLTSEWKDYRWGPLAGKPTVPNLVDAEGAMWRSVEETAKHASADEIEKEIRSQLERARAMGFEPTHMDSHMGTLFARQDYLERYFKVGIENKIPVMFPGGHDTMIMRDGAAGLTLEQAQKIGKMLWNAGLPVLDDLHNISYGWTMDKMENPDEKVLQKYKTQKYIESFKDLQAGVTMVIMHCTSPTEVFEHISDSGNTRSGDMLAMIDPVLKKYIQDNGIILTTWRELKQRRDKIK